MKNKIKIFKKILLISFIFINLLLYSCSQKNKNVEFVLNFGEGFNNYEFLYHINKTDDDSDVEFVGTELIDNTKNLKFRATKPGMIIIYYYPNFSYMENVGYFIGQVDEKINLKIIDNNIIPLSEIKDFSEKQWLNENNVEKNIIIKHYIGDLLPGSIIKKNNKLFIIVGKINDKYSLCEYPYGYVNEECVYNANRDSEIDEVIFNVEEDDNVEDVLYDGSDVTKLLPIGSMIVLDDEKESEIVIGGYIPDYIQGEKPNKDLKDYIGFYFPDGFNSTKESIVKFNQEDIKEVYCLGYSNDEAKNLKQKLNEYFNGFGGYKSWKKKKQ